MTVVPIERFVELSNLGFRHGFTGRAPGIDVQADRAEALARLDACHTQARTEIGAGELPLVRAEQVHGNAVLVLRAGQETPVEPAPGVDALVTDREDVCLGIYVADCCAVYLADPRTGAIGLAHSGKKGTDLEIVPATIRAMNEHFGSRSEELTVQLSPCIRPPYYEVDFAAQIVAQCRELGVGNVSDSGACTAADPERYYSFRLEKGRTGRMLALLASRSF